MSSAEFLSADEKVEVERRLKLDRSSLAEEYDTKYLVHAFTDWKIYVHMITTIGIYIPLYSISLFLPTIVKAMGYTNEKSQLMSVPPYVAACVCTVAAGFFADRLKQRGLFMIGFCAIGIIGFALLISTSNPHVQYAGTFLTTCGIYPLVPMGVAWNGNNIGGSTKRAVGIAMHVGFGNLGGIVSAFSYRSKDAPRYYAGHGLLMATTSMSLCLCIFMTLYLRRENSRRDALMASQGYTLESYSEDMKEAEREKGDNATVSIPQRIPPNLNNKLTLKYLVLPLHGLESSEACRTRFILEVFLFSSLSCVFSLAQVLCQDLNEAAIFLFFFIASLKLRAGYKNFDDINTRISMNLLRYQTTGFYGTNYKTCS